MPDCFINSLYGNINYNEASEMKWLGWNALKLAFNSEMIYAD